MKRRISWLAAMRDVRADRDVQPPVREQRLQTEGMSSWRGLSGRRHVVQVLPFGPDALYAVNGDVAIAVRREADGLAHIVAIGNDVLRPSWWTRARNAGATELHVHRLAESRGERATIMMDLLGP